MLVRLCWPACPHWDRDWHAPPLDGVWVECSPEEARELIHPRLGQEKARLSDVYAEQGEIPTRDGRGRLTVSSAPRT
jgi:hypothetical protein